MTNLWFLCFFDRCLETCCHRRLHFCSLNGLAEPCGFDEIWHPMGMYIMGYHQHLWVITRNTTRKLNQSTLNVASSGSSMIRIFFWGSCGTERTEKGLNWLNATVPPLSLVHHVDCCRWDSEHVKDGWWWISRIIILETRSAMRGNQHLPSGNQTWQVKIPQLYIYIIIYIIFQIQT